MTILNGMWEETLASARGKTLQLMMACLAFTTAMAWKAAILGLILHLYHKGIIRLLSLWLYALLAICAAVAITGCIHHEFHRLGRDLKRNLGRYSSWVISTETNDNKSKQDCNTPTENNLELVSVPKESRFQNIQSLQIWKKDKNE